MKKRLTKKTKMQIFLHFLIKQTDQTHRERERERERDKCLEAKKMKENENPETLKRLRVFFFFNGKGHVEFGYIVFRLNGSQWVFS